MKNAPGGVLGRTWSRRRQEFKVLTGSKAPNMASGQPANVATVPAPTCFMGPATVHRTPRSMPWNFLINRRRLPPEPASGAPSEDRSEKCGCLFLPSEGLRDRDIDSPPTHLPDDNARNGFLPCPQDARAESPPGERITSAPPQV